MRQLLPQTATAVILKRRLLLVTCTSLLPRAQVYEAQGELMAVATIKVALRLPARATFADYCARPRVPDVQAVVPLNFSSGFSDKAADGAAAKASQGASAAGNATPRDEVEVAVGIDCNGAAARSHSGSVSRRSWSGRRRSSSGAHAQAGNVVRGWPAAGELLTLPSGAYVQRTQADGTGRRVKARLWLARDVAINQRQLLPLLDLMSTQNKYIGKACSSAPLTCNPCGTPGRRCTPTAS